MKLLTGLALFVIVQAQNEYSCEKKAACGNAIQDDDKIVCYCVGQCLSGNLGPCCSDFETACPAEFQAGKSTGGKPTVTMPALPEGCSAPESTVIPVPSQTMNWEESGKTCKGACSSVMVDNDKKPVCYCDSSCLLTADCCVDFTDVCPIDKCILAMVTPQQQPAQSRCDGNCGLLVQIDEYKICSCESNCLLAGTCCEDFTDKCPSLVPKDLPTAGPDSCFGKCGQKSDSCWCDYQCIETGDCCSNYVQSCGVFAKFPSQTQRGLGSCKGKCNGAGIDCWCDKQCLSVGDCCWDYLQECQKE